MPEPVTLICAGGGTGGHIYPAIAIAERLIEVAERPVRLVFLCSLRDVDARVLSSEPLAKPPAIVEPIPAHPFSVGPRGLLRLAWHWGACVRTARAHIKRARRDGSVHVLYTGGFVSAPVVRAAVAERCAGSLINLDAIPGKANRFVARHLLPENCLTAIPVAGDGAWNYVGPVVRRAAIAPASQGECRTRLGLDPSLRTLVVMGGSLGAESISTLAARLAEDHAGALDGWQVFAITGRDKAPPKIKSVPLVSVEYLSQIGLAWGAADLVLSRAGAGSVAESARNRVPTVFFPYPGHKDQHQAANARVLADAGGARISRDHRDTGLTLRDAGPMLTTLLRDGAELASMRSALAAVGAGDGADQTARHILLQVQ